MNKVQALYGRVAAAAFGAVLSATALALDFRSASDHAILYDAPSTKGVKHYILLRGTPVEVVLAQDKWTKVRDSGGNLAWIESRQLAPARTVLVRVDRADIRAAAEDKSAVVFSAEKNVVLELLQASPPGWAKVRLRDSKSGDLTGYIKASLVWGL